MDQEIEVLVKGQYVSAVQARYCPEKFQNSFQNARHTADVYCLCVESRLRLLVKSRAGKLHLAAWPDQAHLHSQACPFYTPDTKSTKAQTATPESMDSQKPRGNVAPGGDDEGSEDVRLWLVLHELWAKSSMNRWVPSWRRDWALARLHLLRAAKEISVGGTTLGSKLYLPQTFSAVRRDEINREWKTFASPLLKAPRGSAMTESGYVLGVVAEVQKDSRGYWIRLQHHRESFFVSIQMWLNLSKLSRRGWSEISNGSVPKGRVIALLRVEAMANLHFAAADCVLMRVSEKYLPANLDFEDVIVRLLLDSQRSFYRPVSFEQSHGVLANYVLTDTAVKDCDLYLTGSGFPQHRLPSYTEERRQDSIARGHASWHWAKADAMPALPCVQSKQKIGG